MLFVLIALWGVALILLLSDSRSAINRRLSGVAFTGGAGALAAVIDGTIIPHVEAVSSSSETAVQMLYMMQAASSLTSYYGLPYTFLLFSLAYRPIKPLTRLGLTLPLLLFVPIALCLLFTPGYNELYPVTYKIVVWWAVPYMLFGTVNVLLKRNGLASQARKHAIVCLAVLPTVLLSMTMSYVLPSFGMLRMWVYNTWFVSIGVAVFLIGMFTYGFMGVRILIERRRLDTTLRAVTSGTAILNHAIKNDVGKMRLFGEKMKAYAIETGQTELLADVETVLHTSRHIQEMIGRVHRRTEDLQLRTTAVDLNTFIEKTIESFKPMLGSIRLRLELPEVDWRVTIDPAQVGESMSNLISNALEAMKGDGELVVQLKETKRELWIRIADTGPGMGKAQAVKALEPFFTTKSGDGANFGLGLPYAYNVMRKHGGTLQIASRRGEGTSVNLVFRKNAVRAVRIEPEAEAPVIEGREANG
ncbi:sensor histidine kinase [Paenibacillus gorillae]|uniref:sensor histidine kinase n=1 Tax=Paenibacillus gorillae TaxID=1243662 RepID=UPI0004B56EEA|nr:HAMP domain-containing sensor histidine kinase [Paenibacillus gorillae]